MSSIKLNHIPILKGVAEFTEWKQKMSATLQSLGLWGWVDSNSSADNPLSPFPIETQPVITAKSTPEEVLAYCEWWHKNFKVKDIIKRHLSPICDSLMPTGLCVTVRAMWNELICLYGCMDITAQHTLREHVLTLHLRDYKDFDQYIGEIKSACNHFLVMGVPVHKHDIVHNIVRSLPNTTVWSVFKQLCNQAIQLHVDDKEAQGTPFPPDTLLRNIIKCLSIECYCLQAEAPVKPSGPGSEYANAATEICKHPKNPKGIACTICKHMTHDHCFSKGGGMEGQENKITMLSSAIQLTSIATVANIPEVVTVASAEHSFSDIMQDLSCAAVDNVSNTLAPLDVAVLVSQHLYTLLNSGTSSHLIKNCEFFWMYDPSQARSVKMANHGVLNTMAGSDCMACVLHGNVATHLKLCNCLHAPDAFINLLSVGRLVSKGFACTFDGDHVCISSPQPSRHVIASSSMSGTLFPIDIQFIPHPLNSIVQQPSPPPVFAGFTKIVETVDLWHHCLRHVSECATLQVLKSASGASFASGSRLLQCEPCIIGKHFRCSYLSFSSPATTDLLQLIHCNICRPFPTATPHNKCYFILFLNDYSNVVNVQLLATKDQAYDAWLLVLAKWELKLSKRVKAFWSDNSGEFIDSRFAQALVDHGIEH